jgi:hypothetical protein
MTGFMGPANAVPEAPVAPVRILDVVAWHPVFSAAIQAQPYAVLRQEGPRLLLDVALTPQFAICLCTGSSRAVARCAPNGIGGA